MPLTKEWFARWFDSPYYHVLYHDRDVTEAKIFIDNLLAFLKPDAHAIMLDVACGKGRHALQLHSHGYQVIGYDLSPANIEYDKQFETDSLEFYVHDMRHIFRINYFDYVFNLFSSFGYFESDHENEKVIQAHASALKKGGFLVLDFLNANYVTDHIKEHETKTVNGIVFNISKVIDGRFVVKNIHFNDCNQNFHYQERIRLFTLEDFESIFAKNGLILTHSFGNYHLDAFDARNSDRLILIAQKQ